MSSHTALPIEPLDVLIIGAGVSGIGAAAYLRRHQPHKVFAILESRERMGGTWDLFRYPGIRSDSDLYTFGFDFKPWTKAKSLADAADILEYLREAVAEYQLDPFIQYRQKVVSANWQSDKGLWAVCVEDGPGCPPGGRTASGDCAASAASGSDPHGCCCVAGSAGR